MGQLCQHWLRTCRRALERWRMPAPGAALAELGAASPRLKRRLILKVTRRKARGDASTPALTEVHD